MSESRTSQLIRAAFSKMGARIFRNQTGTYKLADGRYLSSGLCPGSSDLIGWAPIVVGPEMVGRTLAVFVAVEVKSARGRITNEQQDFLDTVNAMGGIAFAARSEEEATDRLIERVAVSASPCRVRV